MESAEIHPLMDLRQVRIIRIPIDDAETSGV